MTDHSPQLDKAPHTTHRPAPRFLPGDYVRIRPLDQGGEVLKPPVWRRAMGTIPEGWCYRVRLDDSREVGVMEHVMVGPEPDERRAMLRAVDGGVE